MSSPKTKQLSVFSKFINLLALYICPYNSTCYDFFYFPWHYFICYSLIYVQRYLQRIEIDSQKSRSCKILKIQKVKDKLFVLLFLYSRYIKINLPTTDKEVAVYGIIFRSSLFIIYLSILTKYIIILSRNISKCLS